MTLVSEPGRIGGEDLKKLERIRLAALKSFATDGAAATSLRSVAADAGVSLGLVQHHFATKAGLIQAVDDYVMSVVIEMVSRPVSAHPEDSIADMGSRITNLVIEHPDVVDYFGRALIDGSPLGTTIWDTLAAFGMARWNDAKGNRRSARRHRCHMGRPQLTRAGVWAPSSCAAISSDRSRVPFHARAARAVAGVRQHAAA